MDLLRRGAYLRTALISMSLICMAMTSFPAGADSAASGDGDHRCGGEPCAAVIRGLFTFFDRDVRPRRQWPLVRRLPYAYGAVSTDPGGC